MQEIVQNLLTLHQEIEFHTRRIGRDPATVTIIAVSKSQPVEKILAAASAGHRDFGENYALELHRKATALSSYPIRWHYIGRLQSNKVKYVVPIVQMVHSVDREAIALELNRQAERIGRTLEILIQVNTSGEETKGGIPPHMAHQLVGTVLGLKYLRARGLMTLAGLEHSPEQVRSEFRMLRLLRDELARDFGLETFTELSMGMSSDFLIALEEGTTILRIGTRIFGARAQATKTSGK